MQAGFSRKYCNDKPPLQRFVTEKSVKYTVIYDYSLTGWIEIGIPTYIAERRAVLMQNEKENAGNQ